MVPQHFLSTTTVFACLVSMATTNTQIPEVEEREKRERKRESTKKKKKWPVKVKWIHLKAAGRFGLSFDFEQR